MEDVTIRQAPTGPEAPAKVDPAPAAGQPNGEAAKPDYLLPKFKSVEDQAKAYTELEKQLGKKAPDPAAAATPPNPEATKEAPKGEDPNAAVKQDLAKSKIDFDGLVKEFGDNNNALKPESYKRLEDAGIPKQVVDDYIAGQVGRAEAFKTEMFTSVGGQETFNAMIEWAKGNMPEAEIKAYNDALDKGPEAVKLAVTGLHARYLKETGGNPNLVGGGIASGVTGYRSYAEQQRDMQDPRYMKDPAFREEVTQKSLASNF